MPGALQGLRVLDCTHVVAGAYCGMLLADLGADVVKIEPPRGDSTRGQGGSPFRAFDFLNRNKRAICVDLSLREGVALVHRLARTADVFVENYRPGALDKLGLGETHLRELNPGLIYCSVSGFGHEGPYRERAGLDLVAQAMSGLISMTGQEDDPRPTAAGVPVADLNAGVFAALGVLAALRERDRTGQGQRVESTLQEAALGYTLWEAGFYFTTGEVARPRGSRHRLASPYGALKAKDGYLVVGVNTPKLWRAFCAALGEPGLAEEEAYATPRLRLRNREALERRLEARLAGDTCEAWLTRLVAHGVPAGPINTIAEALADPQVKARGMVAEVEGRRYLRAPVALSRTPAAVTRRPPELGEHTLEILAEAGLAQDEIDLLADQGAIITTQDGR